jgi:hypothetical protein
VGKPLKATGMIEKRQLTMAQTAIVAEGLRMAAEAGRGRLDASASRHLPCTGDTGLRQVEGAAKSAAQSLGLRFLG